MASLSRCAPLAGEGRARPPHLKLTGSSLRRVQAVSVFCRWLLAGLALLDVCSLTSGGWACGYVRLDSALLGGSAAGRFLRAQAFGASYRWPLIDCGMPRTLGSSRLPYLRALERRAACGCPVFNSSEVLSLTCVRGLAASQAMCSTRAPSDFCFLPSWEVELLAAPEWPGALACLLPGAGLPPPWCGLDVDGSDAGDVVPLGV